MKKFFLAIFLLFSVFSYSSSIAIRSQNETLTVIVSSILQGIGFEVSDDSRFLLDVTDIGISSSNGFTGTIELDDLITGETIGVYNLNSSSPNEMSLSILNLLNSIKQ